MTEDALIALAEYIEDAHTESIMKREIQHGELVFTVKRNCLRPFITFLLNDANCDCKQLMGICGADYPEWDERFEVVYMLLSIKHNHRIRVKTRTDETTAVESLYGVYHSAGWYEREVWDMYGILFDGNPDLRRILTDYGFEGHPLRKDFPLTGFVEVRYDEDRKRVVYEPVKLTQAYRNFDFESPWEGMTDIQLPGDEKVVKPAVGTEEQKRV